MDTYDKENQKFKEDIRDQLKKSGDSSGQVDEDWKSSVDENIRAIKLRQDVLKSIPDDVYIGLTKIFENFLFFF